jgi:geranylgeranyl reductase family protein
VAREAEFDVAVVGAGPGGSNAVAVALRGGLRVAQIERHKFPRVKPCAGGLTVKSLNALQFDLQPAIRYAATSFEFNSWNGRKRHYSRGLPMIRMVYRPEFDNHLVDQNRHRPGFTFFDNEMVLDARYVSGAFRIQTENRTLTSRQLIAADGAYSPLNRQFAVANPKAAAVAIETNIPRADVQTAQDPTTCFDFGVIRQGYGWIFPKNDHLSFGLYTFARGMKDLRRRLSDYVALKDVALRPGAHFHFQAHLIPVGGYRVNVPAVPLYVVGDAGGFADALTGEGIYHALESGRLAGEAACRVHRGHGSHHWYYRRLWKAVLPDTFLTYVVSRWFYRDPGSRLGLLERSLIWRPLMQGLAQGATFTKSIARSGQYLVESSFGSGVRLQDLGSG